MEKQNKNKIGLVILLIAIVLFAGGLTFAFFRVGVTEKQEKLTVTTGTLALTFADNNTGITASEIALGDSTTKEFSIKNTGTLPAKTNMLWNNLINTYIKESMSYTLQYKTSEAGNWETTPLASGNIPRSAIAQDFTLAENITIPVGATYYYKLTITFNSLTDVNQTVDTSAKLTSSFKLGDAVTLSDVDKTRVVLGKKVNSGTPNFASSAITDETKDGLYAMADDYGSKSYYYRGAVTDNYVKFANKFWRIIRINGDGSLRMIYDGTVAHKNGEGNETFETTGVDGSTLSTDRFINNGTFTVFNTNHNDNAYVGWMYGTAGGTKEQAQINTNNSPIKDLVNTWYDNNLASYDTYIADSIYCNDRSIPGQSVTGWADDTGLGTGINATGYGALGRFIDTVNWVSRISPTPQFTCPQKNDAFTVSDNVHGNAVGATKSRKIGLITADEIVAAGAPYGIVNRNYYLYKASNIWYWTLSPMSMYTNGNADMFYVHTTGFLASKHGNSTDGAVAPVISISKEYATQLVGSGTAENPFRIPGVA